MIGFEILEALQTVPSLKSLTTSLLAEGGYAPLYPPEQIEKLRPQVVLLSDAAGDGGLDPQVLDTLQGYTLLRTDQNGWIELTTDGEQILVEVERR